MQPQAISQRRLLQARKPTCSQHYCADAERHFHHGCCRLLLLLLFKRELSHSRFQHYNYFDTFDIA